MLISLHRLFEHDLADGSLEQWLLVPRTLIGLVATKIAAHWLIACLPLILVAPLLALQYGLSNDATLCLLITLLLGTPTLALLGALGAALTLGMRGQVLQALIVLPMSIPPLVFACSAVSASQQGLPAGPALNLLGACLSLATFLCPWATAAALRLALE
ncbi:heme exporter protein CcmB [Herminiimonas contaminans]|uniref:heme exporter protein CcmB n=1 Tax=Herminiimonas contaminans TaxID=1111140 RepID=UPI002DDAC11A|nr:heme exporter protein CcmB [Herminiimonas contaminans]